MRRDIFLLVCLFLVLLFLSAQIRYTPDPNRITNRIPDCAEEVLEGRWCYDTTLGIVTYGNGTVAQSVTAASQGLDAARLVGNQMTAPYCGSTAPAFELCPPGQPGNCVKFCFDPLTGIQLRGPSASDIQMKNARFRGMQAAAPSDPMEGDWYIDTTTTHHICVYDGAAWDSSDGSACA